MARRILGRATGIGKRWPYRALNFLSPKQLWKYLAWKSRDLGKEPAFNLGENLGKCRKILILAPESFCEILVSIPVLQTLAFENPQTELLILVNEENSAFLAGIFEPKNVLSLVAEELFWGENHFRERVQAVENFKPDLALNLRENTPPLLAFLLGSSKSSLRAQICSPKKEGESESEGCPSPFVNLTLNQASPHNHLRRYMLAMSLWNFAPQSLVCKWSRFKPGPMQVKEALARLAAKGLRPESTRLFLWMEENSPMQQAIYTAAVQERHGPGESKSLAILVARGEPFSVTLPTPEQTLGIPCLEAESTGLLLAFFSLTAKSIGLQSPLLHLASLSETDVEAHFTPEESCWNTSFLNPRLKVIELK